MFLEFEELLGYVVFRYWASNSDFLFRVHLPSGVKLEHIYCQLLYSLINVLDKERVIPYSMYIIFSDNHS